MNKKDKTMTASGAARVLGVSRESVFYLIRIGRLERAGYKRVRGLQRCTLVTLESVLEEKTRRKAAKGCCKGETGIDRTPAPKTRGRGQRIEKRGNFSARDAYLAKKCPELAKYGLVPAAFDHADPSAVQTVTEIPAADSGAVRCEPAEKARRFYELACFWSAVFCAACAGLCVILAAFKP